jgi:hypothetical protein
MRPPVNVVAHRMAISSWTVHSVVRRMASIMLISMDVRVSGFLHAEDCHRNKKDIELYSTPVGSERQGDPRFKCIIIPGTSLLYIYFTSSSQCFLNFFFLVFLKFLLKLLYFHMREIKLRSRC